MAWKIRQKLFFGFFVYTLLIIIFGFVARNLNQSISHDISQLKLGSTVESSHYMDLIFSFQGVQTAAWEYIEERLLEEYLGSIDSDKQANGDSRSREAMNSIKSYMEECKRIMEASKKSTELSLKMAEEIGSEEKVEEEEEELRRLLELLDKEYILYKKNIYQFFDLGKKKDLQGAVDFLKNTLKRQSDKIIGSLYYAKQESDEEQTDELSRIEQNIKVSNLTILHSIGISLVIAILISFLISRNISKPIIRLKDFAVKIGKGKFDERIETRSMDEIGMLTLEFNDMAGRLNDMTSQLHEANEQLEQKVNERTAELSELNKQLQVEIAERKQAQEEIGQSLRQKELMLKEIHHRVKNNLQVICSLLYLQSESSGNPETAAVLDQSQNRIRSMAMVHEILYNSRDYSNIDVQDYLEQLTGSLGNSYQSSHLHFEVEVKAENISMELGKAISCGLIVNELFVNSMKHAFQNGTGRVMEDGRIVIELLIENSTRYLLKFSDNGKGFPEGFDLETSEGFGLQLVLTLTQQLEGNIRLEPSGGATFLLDFPVKR